jgi:hypothetical protein
MFSVAVVNKIVVLISFGDFAIRCVEKIPPTLLFLLRIALAI